MLAFPLDWILSGASHIAILRALMDSKEGMSGRAVARASRINHQTCAQALKRLEGLGIVRRMGSERTQLIRLNFDNFLVQQLLLPLLRKEREFLAHIRQDMRRSFGQHVRAAVLFGSAARGETKPGSDVDLLLIAGAESKATARDRAREFSAAFLDRYGFRLSPIVFTAHEATARIRKKDPLLENILKEGVDLGPGRLREVLNDTKAKR